MTDRQLVGVVLLSVGLILLAVLLRVVLSRWWYEEESAVDAVSCVPLGLEGEVSAWADADPAEWAEQDWDDATLASLHEEPPTDERLERVVLALVESPEQWRERMEREDNDWRLRVQNTLGLAVDFGERLELVA